MSLVRRKYRMSRRIGQSLFGEEKDAVKSRQYPPGMHGHKGYPRASDYARQLHEKQKLRFMYNISEKTLRRAYKSSSRRGNTISNLVGSLESRLDAALYRGKLAVTIHAAAQLVAHKHVLVNGKVVNIRSFLLSKGDVVSVKPASRDLMPVLAAIADNNRSVPDYLSTDNDARTITVVRIPTEHNGVPYPVQVDFNLVLSYYSA